MNEHRPQSGHRGFAHGLVIPRLRARLRVRESTSLSMNGFRAAAVAVVLLDVEGMTHVILTLRSQALRAHSGQVSFPGGRCDPEDASVVATAARESHEEIGLVPEQLDILGILDDEATPSGFIITPVIAALGARPRYTPNRDEVADVFEAPLALFSDPSRAEPRGERRVGELSYPLRAYRYHGFEITGATAHILERLSDLAS